MKYYFMGFRSILVNRFGRRCPKCGNPKTAHNPWCITLQPKDEAPF